MQSSIFYQFYRKRMVYVELQIKLTSELKDLVRKAWEAISWIKCEHFKSKYWTKSRQSWMKKVALHSNKHLFRSNIQAFFLKWMWFYIFSNSIWRNKITWKHCEVICNFFESVHCRYVYVSLITNKVLPAKKR